MARRWGKCFLCGRFETLETHHLFRCVGGASRTKADRLGLTVELCARCHHERVHKNAVLELQLREYGQRKAMVEQGWDKERFIREFGKNYLDDWQLEDVARIREQMEDLTEEELGQELREPEWIREEPEEQEIYVSVKVPAGFRVSGEVLPF